MKVMAQMAMVMNLDKCIGCHTCSVTCKQAWTNRPGTEYVWFNNVETRPGVGYPRTYEDQDRWRGGWIRDKKGRLRLRDGGRIHKLLHIFANPKLPTIDDYYEPWTYDYENLTQAPAGDTFPTAAPRSQITGEPMKVSWGSNWDDNLAGSPEIVPNDPVLKKVSDEVKLKLEETFMFYLPRICEHCLNPSCVASCPSGAMYKRTEDGIVLVDQDRCRGWRMCVSGCPYKKVYFNHKTGKAEKCTLCYPRIEVGLPTVCSETCVGRLRYLGLVLYDVDRVLEAASVENDTELYEAQRQILLDPNDPEVIAAAQAEGISNEWIEAAQRSPVYALINTYRVALPLHPEYRTMPMVWYIPPLSPVVDAVSQDGHDGEDLGNLFGALEALRIPIQYLAELFTAGDTKVVAGVLKRLAAMRSYMRDINLGRETQPNIPHAVGMTEEQIYNMYRLLAIAKYEERYVIPTSYSADLPAAAMADEMGCSLSYDDGPGMYAAGPFGPGSGAPVPVAVETFHALQQRQMGETAGAGGPAGRRGRGGGGRSRINLLNWDGNGVPAGLFPDSNNEDSV
jgi:nitrate reductase / nitrite oxidoreductase, beta subunit